jgi:amino acid permease
MVAGILLLGPLLAPFILLILLTGPVYYAKGSAGELRRWQGSTNALVIFFALVVTAVWLYRVLGGPTGPNP